MYGLGAKRRKVTLKAFGMLSTSLLVDVKQANLESSSVFMLISETQGHNAQAWSFCCLPSNGQTKQK